MFYEFYSLPVRCCSGWKKHGIKEAWIHRVATQSLQSLIFFRKSIFLHNFLCLRCGIQHRFWRIFSCLFFRRLCNLRREGLIDFLHFYRVITLFKALSVSRLFYSRERTCFFYHRFISGYRTIMNSFLKLIWYLRVSFKRNFSNNFLIWWKWRAVLDIYHSSWR